MSLLLKRFLIVIGIIIFGAVLFLFIWKIDSANQLNQLLMHKRALGEYLAPRLLDEIENFDGEVAVALYDMNSKESLFINEEVEFKAASLIKIPIMLELFWQIQEKKISMEKTITYNITDHVEGFSHLAKNPYGTRFTVETLLKYMIQVSDNDATRMLIRVLGADAINARLKKYGLAVAQIRHHLPESYPVLERINKTTARAVLTMYQLMHDTTLFSKKEIEVMNEILHGQVLNEELPRYLPQGTSIGHKTGQLSGIVHDAGIITLHDKKYLVCLLSSSLQGLAEQTASLGRISRIMYNYFSYNKGPFLLGAQVYKKKKNSILLLAGQSYLTSTMKDIAEYFQRKGFVVYCLPYIKNRSEEIQIVEERETAEVLSALNLLSMYAEKQHLFISAGECKYAFDPRIQKKIESLIILPSKKEKQMLFVARGITFWYSLKKIFTPRLKYSFNHSIYTFNKMKSVWQKSNRRISVPVYFCTSKPFRLWLRSIVRVPSYYTVQNISDMGEFKDTDFSHIESFIHFVNKQKGVE